jgi:hypothetical protein
MPRSLKYDYRDLDAVEAKLIRIGHFLWRTYLRARNARIVRILDLEASLEEVWEIKRKHRETMKAKRKAAGAKYFAQFGPK